MITAELQAARDRIQRGWCQNAIARDAYGHEVEPDTEDAVCWCAVGALGITSGQSFDALKVTLDSLGMSYGLFSLVEFNNAKTTTQGDVLALFDLTIERLSCTQ